MTVAYLVSRSLLKYYSGAITMSEIPIWRMKHIASTNAHLPASPGLYAIGNEDEICGLEIGRIYVYVGKTGNLRRRLSEHTHLTELHPDLGGYLRRYRGKAKIWYTSNVAADDLDTLERRLIRELKPIYNRVKYEKG